MTFCDLTIYNDNPLLTRLDTELDLLPNFEWFHRTFATDVACRQGTLTPPDTWSRPFGTCITFYLLRPILFRTCRYLTGLCSSNIPRYFLDFTFKWSFSLCIYIPLMDIMLDFICKGPVDLSGARRTRPNTKWKILAHSGTRTHNPQIRSLMLYRLS